MMFSLAPRRGSPRTTPAGRPRAPPFCSWPARPALAAAGLDRCRDLQLRQQPRWNRCSGGCKHDILEGAILRARLLLLAIVRRFRWCLGFRRLRVFGWRGRQTCRPRREDQPGSCGRMRCRDQVNACKCRNAAGGFHGEQRSPHRGDPQCQCGRAQCFDAGIVDPDIRQPRACSGHGCGVGRRLERFAQSDVIELEQVGEPFEQHGCRPLIVGGTFVEGGKQETRRRTRGDAITLDQHLAGFTRRGKSRRHQRRHPLRAGDDDQATVGHRQQSPFGDRPPRPQGSHEIEAAEQPIVVHVRGYSPDRRTVRQQ